MVPMIDLRGRVAVIVGGARDTGLALALRAAEAGMRVALADSHEHLLTAALMHVGTMNVEAITVRTDISDLTAVRTLAQRVEAELGPPWLICNCPGPTNFASCQELTPAELKWMIDLNLWGVTNGVQVFAPNLIKRGGGHIVNIASAGTFGIPGTAPYVASTQAIVGLSESLYRELDRLSSQVGVTVVCPEPVNTILTSATDDAPGVRDPDRPARSVAHPAREFPRDVPSPDELAEQIFAAVRQRRFWLVPQAGQKSETTSFRSETMEGEGTVPTPLTAVTEKQYGLAAAKPITLRECQ
jgi:NAD(P)-dependent dehydrogenase (short-subunit alcohol dehydrogenase family)